MSSVETENSKPLDGRTCNRLFSCMANIIDRTQFGHRRSENNTTIIYDIVDIRKAKYLFMRMDLDCVQDVDRNTVLKKRKKTGD